MLNQAVEILGGVMFSLGVLVGFAGCSLTLANGTEGTLGVCGWLAAVVGVLLIRVSR